MASLSTKTIIAAPHIQLVLVEAARLAPRYSDELASLYERERQRGNGNRATLAVARKMRVWMLAVKNATKTSAA